MNILTIAAIGAGLYLLTQPKKPTVSSTNSKGFIFTCDSLKITDEKLFEETISSKVDEIISEFKINKESLFSLDIVKVSKRFFNKLDPYCSTDPSKMSKNGKMLFLISSFILLDRLLRVIALNILNPNFNYNDWKNPGLVAIDCPNNVKGTDDKSEMKDCKYYFDTNDPLYNKYQELQETYKDQIANHLKILTDNETVKIIFDKLSQTKQYP